MIWRFHGILRQTEFWFIVLVPIALMAVVLFFLVGRSPAEDVVRISFEQTSKVSPVQQISGGTTSHPEYNLLHVAIAGVLSPAVTLEHYQELLSYMEQKLGQQVTLILRPTYAEINDLVKSQRADVAFVCSLAYAKGNQDFGMELLVAPQMYGETVYYSYLIVPQESSAVSLRDLKGAGFAFTDPMSNSGHLVPTYQLSLLGETPASFFGEHSFTYSHDNSITAVADKLLDGAAVDSLVYDQLIMSNPELASKIKIITRWGPYGIPPVVINPTLDAQLKKQLRDFFLNLHNSDEGARILNNLDIDKFVVVSNDIYNSIREMNTKLGW